MLKVLLETKNSFSSEYFNEGYGTNPDAIRDNYWYSSPQGSLSSVSTSTYSGCSQSAEEDNGWMNEDVSATNWSNWNNYSSYSEESYVGQWRTNFVGTKKSVIVQ